MGVWVHHIIGSGRGGASDGEARVSVVSGKAWITILKLVIQGIIVVARLHEQLDVKVSGGAGQE